MGLILSSILIGLVVLVTVWTVKHVRKLSKMPPGPWGLPFVGYIPWIDPVSPWISYAELAKKYGPVFSVNFCGTYQIILNDWKSINDAYSQTVFTDRPPFLLFELANPYGAGMTGSGKVWHDNRSFVLKSLRSFGMGRSSLETLVAHEVMSWIETLQEKAGKPTDVDRSLDVAVLNVIWKITSGKQTSIDDKDAQSMVDDITNLGNTVNRLGPVQFVRWLTLVPKYNRFYQEAARIANRFNAVYETEIEEHKDVIKANPVRVPQDLIDDYLREREAKKTSDPETAESYGDVHLRTLVTMLFAAGTDTTAITVRYICLLMASHPDVQKRCQDELESVVGKDRLPSWDTHTRLPYIDATIKEVQRVADIVPLSVPHAAAEDAEFHGYFIPKGSWVVSNINACHRDPAHWPDPERFDPTRFLDEEGRPKRNTPSLMPFGIGKRFCIGESLAYMQLFFYVTYLMHHFNIEFPTGFKPDMDSNAGDPLVRRPAPFKVIFKNR